ncbi:hypothetical protein [Kistimonas asteriae]|uniref:hypothetical protein n=1 Tax=Kistimonas asteriae TaxID=517724 RepID=UPI001BA8DD61|nr:hypothetical protein [Kistimonas asteriae]
MEREIVIKRVSAGTFTDEKTGESREFASLIIDGEKFQANDNVVGFVSPKMRIVTAEGRPNLALAERFKSALRNSKKPIKLKVICDILEKPDSMELIVVGVPAGAAA